MMKIFRGGTNLIELDTTDDEGTGKELDEDQNHEEAMPSKDLSSWL